MNFVNQDSINILCPSEKPLLNIKINECVGLCSVEEILKRKCIIIKLMMIH